MSWYVVSGRERNPGRAVELPGGVLATWQAIRLASGEVAWGAWFADDGRVNVQALRRVRNRRILDDSAVNVQPAPAPDPTVPQRVADASTLLVQLFALAHRQGWTDEDLAGCGVGYPGIEGGRGACGLTLAEATLALAPPDWPELRAAGRRPWESTRWSIAAQGWVAPVTPPLEPLSARLVDETVPTPSFVTPDAVPTTAPAAAPEDDALNVDPSAPIPTDVLGRLPVDHVLYAFPKDALPDLITIVRELAAASGAVPNASKVNYLLGQRAKARGLDPKNYRVKQDQIRAILDL